MGYKIFGISKHATEEEIKTAYREDVEMYHPERGKQKEDNLSEEERIVNFIAIQMAYEEAMKKLENCSINEDIAKVTDLSYEEIEKLRKEMSLVLKNYIKSDNINLDEEEYEWFYIELKRIHEKFNRYINDIKGHLVFFYVIQSYIAGHDTIFRFYLKLEKDYLKQNEIPTEILEANPLNYNCSIENFVEQLENLRKNNLGEDNIKKL